MQIILIPGLMNDGWIWRHQVGGLSRLAPVTIARTDGCGTLEEMAERIVTGTVGSLVVIGHSMGGRVALEIAAMAPYRLASLIIFDSGARGPSESERAGRMQLVETAQKEGMAAVARDWLPPMLAPTNRQNTGLVHGITEMLERCSPETFALQQQALLTRPDRSALPAQISCPLLAVTGSEDQWAPLAEHEAIASAAPDGRVEVVNGAGHMLPVEAPESAMRILEDFLTR
ncbi:alpha/beta fold hydrolase [Rhizorhapis sp. SPR117]|uniref:alpha/beta fold hydrolase n=1 Tax=Rhizorhapis sp. SPR117 TaxID=2912611 RepID=UPI001F24D4EB|nr:alpha/beta hydrolase [Rhizorhapis sp. SPR117]